jgi:leucyl-tRNA---protein transferase
MSSPQRYSHFPHIPAPRPVRLVVLPAHDCAYLQERAAVSRAFLSGSISPAIYHEFMDAGFRRSGRLMYQPVCSGCRECQPLRVLVDRYSPTKSQRRVVRKNADILTTIETPEPTGEKFELYRKYTTQWHEHEKPPTMPEFVEFLYDSPITPENAHGTIEIVHRDRHGKLLAVGICDLCELSLSSVYFYFDPDESHRGLGNFGAVWELNYARRLNIPFYYLGYWIRACDNMKYKATFQPYQLLGMDGVWRDDSQAGVVGRPVETKR